VIPSYRRAFQAVTRFLLAVPETRLDVSAIKEQNCGFYDYEMVEGKGLKLVRKKLLPKESRRHKVSGSRNHSAGDGSG
jgi:hypothetical protein